MISPIILLREAVKAVPAVRYALGVGGLIAVIALAKTFQVEPLVGFVGIIVLLAFMGILVVFAKMSTLASKALALPALVLAWFTLLLFIAVSSTLFLSVFIGWPRDLQGWVGPTSSSKVVLDGETVDVIYSWDDETTEHAIGTMYENGWKVSKDYAKAAYWYSKGVDRNDAESMVDLSVLYGNALGVSKDLPKADELILRAGRLGSARGLYKSGLYYRDSGQYQQAIDYLKRAAAKGWEQSYGEIGKLFEDGFLGKARVKEALVWYRKGVDEGDFASMHYLGVSLILGSSGEKDLAKGAELLEKVIENQNYRDVVTATWALGDFYGISGTIISNPARSITLLKRAAAEGHPCSVLKVAESFLKESPPNVKAAIEVLEIGVRHREPIVIHDFASKLLTGVGLPKDVAHGKAVLEAGVEINDVDSILMLGEAYRTGVFGNADPISAARYFSLAVSHGSKDAEDRIRQLFRTSSSCGVA